MTRTTVAVIAVVALAAAALAGARPRPPAKTYPVGCLRQADVAIGYYPYRTTTDVRLLVAPHRDAIAREQLPTGRRFGVQSLPNPRHLSDPGVPAPTNGYSWGYAKRGGKSGWVDAGALRADTPEDPWATGPAGIDFQAGDDFPDDDIPPRFVLGQRAVGTAVITDRTVYQRWAPRSSPMAVLISGQVVRVLWRSSGHVCADVDSRRGWIPIRALRLLPG